MIHNNLAILFGLILVGTQAVNLSVMESALVTEEVVADVNAVRSSYTPKQEETDLFNLINQLRTDPTSMIPNL